MSFRIIEKRDDNTTIAVLENNTENLRKNVSFSDKLSTRTICESNQYSKYLTKKEKGQINLLNKSKEKDIKFNFQDKQSNHLNKDIKIFQSNQKVYNTSQLPAIQSTKLSNVLPTGQTTNNHHFLPTIQINNKICAQEAGQKYQKSNIETKSSLNTTRNNQKINKEFIEPSFSKEEKPEATKIEQTNNKLNTESTFSKETKQNGTEIEQTNKKLNTESTFSKETKQNGTEIEQTNKKLNSEQSSSTNIISTSNFSHSYTYVRRKLLPPKLLSEENKITLVLDLDETLVHSVFAPTSHCDFSFITDPRHHISVCIRPGVKEFIHQVGNLYELVLFTVGNNIYADRIIDFIDPHHMIKHRLYRESCTYLNGTFVKDLSRLGRDLNKVIILDDSPLSYKLQPKNALPISSWIDDPDDKELLRIQNFLIQNHAADNVYIILNEYRRKYLKTRNRKRNIKRKCLSPKNKK